jgi:universal stress protein A
MFKNILVPTDLSEKSVKALEIATSLAEKVDSRVTFLHVVETIEDDDGEEFRSFYEKLMLRAQNKMEKMTREYISSPFVLQHEIICGKRVKEIVRYASDNLMDLIILSSHKLDNIDAADGWATISYRVGILSTCPVLMVK